MKINEITIGDMLTHIGENSKEFPQITPLIKQLPKNPTITLRGKGSCPVLSIRVLAWLGMLPTPLMEASVELLKDYNILLYREISVIVVEFWKIITNKDLEITL